MNSNSKPQKTGRLCFIVFLSAAALCTVNSIAQEIPTEIRQFLSQNCYDCHADTTAEAGLDLELLARKSSPSDLEKWVQVFDRVYDGEMPPSDYAELDQNEKAEFLAAAGGWIKSQQVSEYQSLGRVRGRRLTNLQLERTLHDLLGIDIPLANRMPDEPRTSGFTTVIEGQAMSHFQLEQHLDVVDAALDEAIRRALGQPNEWKRKLTANEVARRRVNSRTREPEILNGQAVTWSSGLVFYGRIPATTAAEDGWYRFKIRHQGLKVPDDHGVWCTVRSGQCRSSAPLMAWIGAFEAGEDVKESTFEAWLPRGHMIEVRPGDTTLKRARFRGGQVGTGEGDPQNVPGIAIEWIEMERIHRGPDNRSIQQLLFGDLAVKTDSRTERGTVLSDHPATDIEKLMVDFARRAFRRPVEPELITPYIQIAERSLANNESFVDAVRLGYRALLCSPRFLYFYEQPGPLDDYSIASRLSYLLWNRMPDATLLKLASSHQLQNERILQQQVERMLADPRGKNFVQDLSDQWLDMNLIEFTEPDPRLYPGFDVIVQNSMLAETHQYLQKMLDENLSVSRLIDSDFTFLNSRLARYYDIDENVDEELQEVSLSRDDHRGGLLTHGSILKVTANGTTTSPVIRGVWVSERLLGQPIPPPPANVSAIEPDIRGAKTIREMLAKHKENGECAACHHKIDPPGFALENFDPSGRWRDNYLKIDKGRRRGKGIAVDASSEMPNGESFQNLAEFKKLVLNDKRELARNVIEKLIVFGTGVGVQFADRDAVENCLEQTAKDDFGFTSIIKSVVTSPVFLTK